jgi:hypothetical protein
MALRMQEEEEISMEEYEALLAAAAANQAEQVGLCPRQRYACVSLHRGFFLLHAALSPVFPPCTSRQTRTQTLLLRHA